jgi:hypothetical protein
MNDRAVFWELLQQISDCQLVIRGLLHDCPPGHPYHDQALATATRFNERQAIAREDLADLLTQWREEDGS